MRAGFIAKVPIFTILTFAGCTIHEPIYYTIYTPEKPTNTNGYGIAPGLTSNANMSISYQTNYILITNNIGGVSPLLEKTNQ